jgi:hypothetical protein
MTMTQPCTAFLSAALEKGKHALACKSISTCGAVQAATGSRPTFISAYIGGRF